METYLDNASTTRVCPEAARAALAAMTEDYGNPSSTHALGRKARALLEEARKTVAGAIGAPADTLYFTSGGTEGDNWALLGAAESRARRGKHIISSAAEHDAVLKTLEVLEKRGFEVTRLSPEPNGSVSPQAVEKALRPDTILVSLMLVNNETGAVTDVGAVSKFLKNAGSDALLHTDAVQAFLKIPFTVKAMGADLLTLSAHKIHGPKGVGALYIRPGLRIGALLHGGGQEGGKRPGTENLPAVAAFAAAVRAGQNTLPQATEHMGALRKTCAQRLQDENPGLLVLGGGAPHILSISLPGYKSEVLMNALEGQAVYVSRSSACKKGARSHVLSALGLSAAVIDGSLRISFSRQSSEQDVDNLCNALLKARESLFTAPR